MFQRWAKPERGRARAWLPLSEILLVAGPTAHAAPAAATVSTAAAVPATAAAARLAGLGLVDRQRTALEVEAVERLDGGVGFLVVRHFDESEPPRAVGLAVHDDLRAGHLPVLREDLEQVVRRAAPGQVADVDILRHTQRTLSRAGGLCPTRPPGRTGPAAPQPHGRNPDRLWGGRRTEYDGTASTGRGRRRYGVGHPWGLLEGDQLGEPSERRPITGRKPNRNLVAGRRPGSLTGR